MSNHLSIISKNTWSSKLLKDQLNDLFGDLFSISCHSPDEHPIKPIFNSDMILIHEPSALVEMQSYIKCDCPLILMRRTIDLDALNRLKKLPAGKSAVVVNLTDYMAHETLTNIYQLGIKGLNLVAWAPNSGFDFPDTDYILTHRIYDFLPNIATPKVILGSRVLNPDVMMDILSYFNVDMERVESIFKYYTTIVPSFLNGVSNLLENNRFLSAQWDLLFNKINKGVALISSCGQIVSTNKLFSNYFSKLDSMPSSLNDLADLAPSLSILSDHIEFSNELADIGDIKYVVDLHFLSSTDASMGMVLMLEPYSQLEINQNMVHKKLVGAVDFAKYSFDDFVGVSPKFKRCLSLSKKFSRSSLPVLIYGESGTGKELLASAIHNDSDRVSSPYVAINCAGISSSLMESELFGYEGSSFTGARKKGSIGLFEKASGGTLFLDEVSEIPFELQAKLLRVLQESEIRRVGANYSIPIDVRIIAASNKDLSKQLELGLFREDLFFRLNVFSLSLPPLRDRNNDVVLIADSILDSKHRTASADFYDFIKNYDWPGNVRELLNFIDYLCVVCDDVLNIEILPDYMSLSTTDFSSGFADAEFLVLKSIAICKKLHMSTGRRSIAAVFSDNFYKISEVGVRSLLLSLADKGYIEIRRGPSGSQITPLGAKFLSDNR